MYSEQPPTSLQECMNFYLVDSLARGQSPRTAEAKRYSLGYFVRWCEQQAITRADEVNWALLESYRRDLAQYRKPTGGDHLTKATQRNRLTAIKVFFRRQYCFEFIELDPGERFELPHLGRRLPACFLDLKEVLAALDYALQFQKYPIKHRAILEVYFATGVRRMELARLDIQDVDLTERILTVKMGKGGNDRRVPIARRACEWVRRYLDEMRPSLAVLNSGNSLFLNNHGLRFKEKQLTNLASRCIHRAGIDKPGACNLFRHSAATLMHDNGADLLYVQELLGHADISTTQVYTHVTIKKLREIYVKTHPAECDMD